MTGPTASRRVPTVVLRAVMAGSIAAALFLAALERLLLGAGVILVVGVPAAALVVIAERHRPERASAEKHVMVRRMSSAFTVVGAGAILVGIVLRLTLGGVVGHLPEALLWIGTLLLFAGVSAYREVRALRAGYR